MRKTNSLIILITITIILVFIGLQLRDYYGPSFLGGAESSNLDKFSEIVQYVSAFYVDEVQWDEAMQGAIQGLLDELDPHSVYISTEDAILNEENFQGKYEGIGIHFDVIDGYLTVITAIHGSPSDKLGLLPGDKIISIDGQSAVGISNSEVPKKLKGPKGSQVDISVIREGIKDPLEFTIVRDEIPIYTVNTFFMTDDSTGYIALGRFAKITEEEISEALDQLTDSGMKRLLLDLRWNAGGYLDQAVKLTSMFIKGHKKIVYTKGRLKDFNEEFYTDTYNHRRIYDIPLIILINNASASASEIVAGAIQDYDRGLIVGTTSFGKGLVQREFPLNDQSRLRLTISKYYTPSGRLIQRPYKGKDLEQYYLTPPDSIESTAEEDTVRTRPAYFTSAGRIVYGGGGIQPDVFVDYISKDQAPALTQKFFQKRLFFEVASRYAQKHHRLKKNFDDFIESFRVSDHLLNELKKVATEKEITLTSEQFNKNKEYWRLRLKAEISRSLWGTEKYYQVLLLTDNQYNAALKQFKQLSRLLQPLPAENLVQK